MASIVASGAASSHLLSQEMPRPRMAKVNLTERERRGNFGRILRRMSQIAGMNRDETASALGVDVGQFGRWLSGVETPQVWRITECDSTNESASKLRTAFLLAQAEVTPGAVIRTVIELERRVG